MALIILLQQMLHLKLFSHPLVFPRIPPPTPKLIKLVRKRRLQLPQPTQTTALTTLSTTLLGPISRPYTRPHPAVRQSQIHRRYALYGFGPHLAMWTNFKSAHRQTSVIPLMRQIWNMLNHKGSRTPLSGRHMIRTRHYFGASQAQCTLLNDSRIVLSTELIFSRVWNRLANAIIGNTLVKNVTASAKFYAQLNYALTNAGIAAWNIKYLFTLSFSKGDLDQYLPLTLSFFSKSLDSNIIPGAPWLPSSIRISGSPAATTFFKQAGHRSWFLRPVIRTTCPRMGRSAAQLPLFFAPTSVVTPLMLLSAVT